MLDLIFNCLSSRLVASDRNKRDCTTRRMAVREANDSTQFPGKYVAFLYLWKSETLATLFVLYVGVCCTHVFCIYMLYSLAGVAFISLVRLLHFRSISFRSTTSLQEWNEILVKTRLDIYGQLIYLFFLSLLGILHHNVDQLFYFKALNWIFCFLNLDRIKT